MNIQDFEYKAETAVALLKALSSKSRLLVLCHLAEGEKSVGQIAERTGLRMATVSQNLAVLRAERLVGSRREGTTIYYRLANDTARDVIDVLYRAYCQTRPTPRRSRR